MLYLLEKLNIILYRANRLWNCTILHKYLSNPCKISTTYKYVVPFVLNISIVLSFLSYTTMTTSQAFDFQVSSWLIVFIVESMASSTYHSQGSE